MALTSRKTWFRRDYTFRCTGCWPVQLTVYKHSRPDCKQFDRVPYIVLGPWGVESKPMITRKTAAAYLRAARREGAPIHTLG